MTKHTINLDAFGIMEMESIIMIMYDMIKEGKRGHFEHSRSLVQGFPCFQTWEELHISPNKDINSSG